MHKYASPDGRGDTTPDETYEYHERVADFPGDNLDDEGTLEELIERHPIISWMRGDEGLQYEPVVLRLTIGLMNISLRPKGWK